MWIEVPRNIFSSLITGLLKMETGSRRKGGLLSSDSCMFQRECLNSPAAAVGFLPLEARLQLLLSQLAVQPHLQLKDYLWIAAFWDR